MEPGDSALGLYNYKARFYSTVLGRFVSADPIASGGWDRYTYVRNNPLRFVDPSGLCVLGRTKCTDKEFENFVSCAGSSDECTLPQEAKDAKISLDDWQRFSRWAVQQQEFWDHFDNLERNSLGQFFGEAVTLRIIHGGLSFDKMDLIPLFGWTHLAGHYGVSTRFFYYSLYDVVNGTSSIITLGDEDLLRQSFWWESTPLFGMSPASWGQWAAEIGPDAFVANSLHETRLFRALTEFEYQKIEVNYGVDVARLNSFWSYSQWLWLWNLGYSVSSRDNIPQDYCAPICPGG